MGRQTRHNPKSSTSIDSADRTALFGDLPVHTGQSFDAFISSVRATPDDAYRYAKGEKIITDGGYEIQLDSPLDFLAVTDHGGNFTASSGYEFTAMTEVMDSEVPAAANLHRNVIFRGDAPDRLFSTLDSPNPEDLWAWMDARRAEGLDVISIPHNSNASNGEMFASETYEGGQLTADYAITRMRNEPVIEISQVKGTSEVHPALSPNDEWANFEIYDTLVGSAAKSTPHLGGFARNALARGLGFEETESFNPYKFGFIGSSDTQIQS